MINQIVDTTFTLLNFIVIPDPISHQYTVETKRRGMTDTM